MRKRNKPKYVISISLETEHHETLKEMATCKGLFISNGSKKGEPNVSKLIKNIAEEWKMSTISEYAKEIFQTMILLGNAKGWDHWISDQYQTKQLIQESVKALHLSAEFAADQELYEGDIYKLIESDSDYEFSHQEIKNIAEEWK